MNWLREAVSDDAVTIKLSEPNSDFPSRGGVVAIEDEQIKYEAATDRELLRCTRGYNGTSAAAHAVKVATVLNEGEEDEETVYGGNAVELVTCADVEQVIPALSEDDRDDLIAPVEGLVIYNTDSQKLEMFNGTAWEVVTSAEPE